MFVDSSPFTNVYEPPFPDGMLPTPELREIEMRTNELLSLYHPMYDPTPPLYTTCTIASLLTVTRLLLSLCCSCTRDWRSQSLSSR